MATLSFNDLASIANDLAQALQAFVTALALIAGGIASYYSFFKKRQVKPRAHVTHDISSFRIGTARVLIHANITIENRGQILLALERVEVRLQQVLPPLGQFLERVESGLDPVEARQAEVEWPMLSDREFMWRKRHAEVEPNESETLQADFIIEEHVEVVQLYSYVSNVSKKKRQIGWSCTSIHEVLNSKNGQCKSRLSGKPQESSKSEDE